MDPAAPCPSFQLGGENIIIKQRRKRLQPPAACFNYSWVGTAPDRIQSNEDSSHLLNVPPAGDDTREDCPLHEHPLTYDGRAGESSPLLSQVCSYSGPGPALPILDHDSEGTLVTVHEFLQDTASRVGNNYGRKNHPTTAKPDAHVKTRTDQRRVSAYPRIQPRKAAHRVSRPRRKKQFAKSLAQRLFEADVFSGSSEPSSRPTDIPNPTHTSTRRPLQFITSLRLTPSLQSRMYNPKKGRQGGARNGSPQAAALAGSGILAVSNSAQDAPPNRPAVSAATSGQRRSDWTRNRDTTQKPRTGGSAVGVMAASSSERRAQGFRARGDGKQSRARVTPNPFGYVPLPLVRVKPRKGAALQQRPITPPIPGHAHRCQTDFNFN